MKQTGACDDCSLSALLIFRFRAVSPSNQVSEAKLPCAFLLRDSLPATPLGCKELVDLAYLYRILSLESRSDVCVPAYCDMDPRSRGHVVVVSRCIGAVKFGKRVS
jgi:hypothetical protein